eukprot:5163873-Prymnesium_polylepis.1
MAQPWCFSLARAWCATAELTAHMDEPAKRPRDAPTDESLPASKRSATEPDEQSATASQQPGAAEAAPAQQKEEQQPRAPFKGELPPQKQPIPEIAERVLAALKEKDMTQSA